MMPNSADPTSDEVNGFMLLASAMTANTEESRITRLENRTSFRWFIVLFSLFHLSEFLLIVFYVPNRVAKEVSVNQNQHVTVNEGEGSFEKRMEDKRIQRLIKHD